MAKPLAGTLVLSLDQAVAAPLTSRKLADAGARVIKLERPEGDFARDYDRLIKGQCTHFVWLNRGKESVVADLTKAEDRRLFEAIVAKADVLVQNLKPGALAKLGFPMETLRKRYPKLICCSISGYGDEGPFRDRKAYDLLIQAESGLASVTGSAEAPARVGISCVDICTGMNAYEAILEALLVRGRTGYTQGGMPPRRIGLSHSSLAPYGVFQTADDVPILISIQNDREWLVFCTKVLEQPALATDPRFANNPARLANRTQVDGMVARSFGAHGVEALSRRLEAAEIAFARVNDIEDILRHPHLRRLSVGSPGGPIELPSPPARWMGEPAPSFGPLPALGEHTQAVRREFLG